MSTSRRTVLQAMAGIGLLNTLSASAQAAPAPHRAQTLRRCKRADQHGLALAGDHVQAKVHAVDAVHVRRAGRAEQVPRARRASDDGVAGRIVGAEVGLRLEDDVPRQAAVGSPHDEDRKSVV